MIFSKSRLWGLFLLLIMVGIMAGCNEGQADVGMDNVTMMETGSQITSRTLSVCGNQLLDAQGNRVVLQGVSTHGIHWFPQYIDYNTFKTFKEQWNCNVIRLAMYPGEGGYCTGANKDELKQLIHNGIKYCTELDMYVVIDWHTLNDDRNPNTFIDEAMVFWDEMSKEYGEYDNVIYEICNEPNNTSWSEVKDYATRIISVIRKNDMDNVIFVGTPQWCQLPMEAYYDRIPEDYNVMYTVHFYAATHKENIRNNLIEAYNAGLPVIVSEYSICDASGNGNVDYDSADSWLEVLDEYGIGRIAWNISNKSESSALLRGDKLKDWTENDLSDTGKWIKDRYTR